MVHKVVNKFIKLKQ